MPRKKKAIVRNPYGFGISGITEPSGFAAGIPSGGSLGVSFEDQGKYSHILENPNLTTAQKKRAILREQGLVQGRQQYASTEERKAAALIRKEERLKALAEQGLGKRVPKTYEEKRSVSMTRGTKKRDWGRLVARSVPTTATYYGLDPGKARKETDIDVREMQELMYQELRDKLGYS